MVLLLEIFTESGIWSLFLLTGLCWPWLKHKITLKKEYRLAIVWTLLSLVLLSCFPEKKTRYLLPLLIPSSMVVAHYVLYIFIAVKEKSLTNGDKIVFRIMLFCPRSLPWECLLRCMYCFFKPDKSVGSTIS